MVGVCLFFLDLFSVPVIFSSAYIHYFCFCRHMNGLVSAHLKISSFYNIWMSVYCISVYIDDSIDSGTIFKKMGFFFYIFTILFAYFLGLYLFVCFSSPFFFPARIDTFTFGRWKDISIRWHKKKTAEKFMSWRYIYFTKKTYYNIVQTHIYRIYVYILYTYFVLIQQVIRIEKYRISYLLLLLDNI